MATIEVFDSPMCCSTGVCGPSVDPALATFASDLEWISAQGGQVTRHNLSQEPKAFAENDQVRELLTERGDEDALPAVFVDGELRSSGRYPSRVELATWSLGDAPSDSLDAVSAELVAIGAAIGANCEPCFKFHYNEARRLGVGSETITAAVRVAQVVKDAPTRAMLELAAKVLGSDVSSLRQPVEDRPAPADRAIAETANDATTASRCGDEESGAEPQAIHETAQTSETSSASGCCGDEPAAVEVPIAMSRSGSSRCC